MVQKLPPPPQLTGPEWQPFNRWLLELTAVLANNGGIDPNSIDGYQATVDQVETNTVDISALQGASGGQSADIAVLQGQVAVLTAGLAAANASITSLSARGEILFGVGVPGAGLGKVNDLYGRTDGPNRSVYIKTGVATWTQITAFF